MLLWWYPFKFHDAVQYTNKLRAGCKRNCKNLKQTDVRYNSRQRATALQLMCLGVVEINVRRTTKILFAFLFI